MAGKSTSNRSSTSGKSSSKKGNTASRRNIKSWLTDMDGVLVHENKAIPGAAELINQWREREIPFLVLTNNSIYTPRDLSARLQHSGIEVPEESIWTSALATASFLRDQAPGSSAFVVGEAGLLTAIHEAGFIMTDTAPDYVVLGETRSYSFEAITKAIRLIKDGARFICTNPDATGPSAEGVLPATGAVAALITEATGRKPYIVGKPNPMMFRSALNKLGVHSDATGMIGDRMDTDIVAGIEAGMHTVLVMTGISDKTEIERYPFRPKEIMASVAELVEEEKS
ncbi:HAD-IIA family hydrolase [Salinicola rhizosphaerae]|uniref:Acid sugar phosphatase n=1 Tax=Salinicola rhizosphaerae TaxID=1443141 RepID=A0ABQ3DXL3_9GAMM|nr:HAD-IIA family hydrolase [Salinicola rhizosphaerae]GHB12016.1 acid sugar phosphatase [Salinicola rhizosphaerae]